jgi:hypothetical protein
MDDKLKLEVVYWGGKDTPLVFIAGLNTLGDARKKQFIVFPRTINCMTVRFICIVFV